MGDHTVQSAEYEEGPDFTRMSFTVTWEAREGDFYYRPDERRGLLEKWISQALDDRDDSPTPHFGSIPEDRILDWPAVEEEPPTLRDEIKQYVKMLVAEGPGSLHTVVADLTAILDYHR